MKPVLALFASFIVAASVVGCAGAPPAQQLAVNTEGAGALRCRDVLLIGSNVIKTLCGTEEQWERYDRYQAWSGQALTLRMQGVSLSGGY